MKLSDETVKVLKNFTTINQSLLFSAGNTIKTMSAQKTVISKVKLQESFPFEFGIYDLNQFIGVLSLFKEPELDFEEKYVTIKDSSVSSNYFYTSKDMILVAPEKDLDMANRPVTFSLRSEDIKGIMQAANVLQLPEIVINGDGKNITMSANDIKNTTSNNFTKHVGESSAEFNLILKVENLKLLQLNYDVSIRFEPAMVEFSSSDQEIKYWVAGEHGSVYNGE
tara:strand:+ start:1795 stop:2466 length:672 start_codon:yes stop_codon:yes gene_type:complete